MIRLVAGVDGVRRVGCVALRGGNVRLQLRLQISRIELREHLTFADVVALLDVDRIGRLAQAGLNRNVFIRRDKPDIAEDGTSVPIWATVVSTYGAVA